jgi:hypothetical protein
MIASARMCAFVFTWLCRLCFEASRTLQIVQPYGLMRKCVLLT